MIVLNKLLTILYKLRCLLQHVAYEYDIIENEDTSQFKKSSRFTVRGDQKKHTHTFVHPKTLPSLPLPLSVKTLIRPKNK